MADRAGVAASFLGQIERADRTLSLATLEKIAVTMNLSLWGLVKTAPSKRRHSWEDRIADLVRSQPTKRKALVFKTLKYLFRNLRAPSA